MNSLIRVSLLSSIATIKTILSGMEVIISTLTEKSQTVKTSDNEDTDEISENDLASLADILGCKKDSEVLNEDI